MIIPGREFISKLFRIRTKEKSPGQKSNLSIKEKHDLIRLCSKIADLAEQVYDLEGMSILETSLTFMVGHLDKKTRDCLFEIVNCTIDARCAAAQHCLVTPAMIKQLHDNKNNIQMGLMAKSVVDLLVNSANECHADQPTKDIIFKPVVLRLALELSHDALNDVGQQIIPMKGQKLRNNVRDMYG